MLAEMLVSGSPAALSWPGGFIVLIVMLSVGGLLWVAAAGVRNRIREEARATVILDVDGKSDPVS